MDGSPLFKKNRGKRKDKPCGSAINNDTNQTKAAACLRPVCVGWHTNVYKSGRDQAEQYNPDKPNRRRMIGSRVQDSEPDDEEARRNKKLAFFLLIITY